MASSSAHPVFPQRPYSTNLGKLPERGAFGSNSQAQQRDVQRAERERERERERQQKEREGQDPMSQLTEEQKEEINEAVRKTAYLSFTQIAVAPINHGLRN